MLWKAFIDEMIIEDKTPILINLFSIWTNFIFSQNLYAFCACSCFQELTQKKGPTYNLLL